MDRDILIIGAGPSGLDSAAEFTRAGLDHDQVEHHFGVGGLWGIDNPTTPMYESAHFISSKRLSCFPGRPCSDDGGAAGEPETRRYRDVICAFGTLSVPNLPDNSGEFADEYRHSSTYHGIDELRGKRVVIIGAENPGCVIACEAAQAAQPRRRRRRGRRS